MKPADDSILDDLLLLGLGLAVGVGFAAVLVFDGFRWLALLPVRAWRAWK